MNDEYLEVMDGDVVIVLRPEIVNDSWTGNVSVIQSDTADGEINIGIKAAGWMALLMTMLPTYFHDVPNAKSEMTQYINDHYPEALEAYMQRYVFKGTDDES